MPSEKNGGQAFPVAVPMEFQFTEAGMTLRDWFAGQIAAGIAAHSGTAGVSYGPHDIAGRSYQVADALLEARDKESTNAES